MKGKIKKILLFCVILLTSIFSLVGGLFLKSAVDEKKKDNLIDENNKVLNKSNNMEEKINEKINNSVDDYNDLISGKSAGKKSE